jgi:hypothetical protein
MSNYTKTTDFSAKDALASGDPEKVALGTDVDVEFDAIAAAMATKEDTANKGAASGYAPLDGSGLIYDSDLPSDIMRLDTAQTVTSGKGDATVTLTDGATVTPDASEGNTWYLTLGGSRTFANATNPRDGQTVTLFVEQGGSGSYTLSWGAAYLFPSGSAPTLSTAVGAIDILTMKYNSTNTAWYVVTSGLDFS